MIGDDDGRWADLIGGYRVPYDPRSAIAKLSNGDRDAAWDELWNELHHQGDVDTASYAAVPELVRIYRKSDVPDWNAYALVGTIELQRGVGKNPEPPSWLEASYHSALRELAAVALKELTRTEDLLVTRWALGIIALAKNLRDHARILLELDDSEVEEIVNDRWGGA